MIKKHKGCRRCNQLMTNVGHTKDDARRALRRHARIPTQANREAVEKAQERMRDAVRMFQQHMNEGVPV